LAVHGISPADTLLALSMMPELAKTKPGFLSNSFGIATIAHNPKNTTEAVRCYERTWDCSPEEEHEWRLDQAKTTIFQ
jgi:hypothetical protein